MKRSNAEDQNDTFDGEPSIDTGDADVIVDVENSANTNGVGGDEPEWPEGCAHTEI